MLSYSKYCLYFLFTSQQMISSWILLGHFFGLLLYLYTGGTHRSATYQYSPCFVGTAQPCYLLFVSLYLTTSLNIMCIQWITSRISYIPEKLLCNGVSLGETTVVITGAQTFLKILRILSVRSWKTLIKLVVELFFWPVIEYLALICWR